MGNENNEETDGEEDGWSGDESFSANLEKENGKIKNFKIMQYKNL